MIICIDFDGTCVTHDFPNTGKGIGALPVLKELIANGHKLILWTVRSDISEVKKNDQEGIDPTAGKHLTNALAWFEKHEIPLYGINKNPAQSSWSTSPKCYANLYIDDAAAGCPLIYDPNYHDRPFVNWIRMREILIQEGYIK